MNKRTLYIVVLAFSVSVMSGCSTLHEAIYGRQITLQPLAGAALGRTTRGEIIEKYGSPDEIDRRWVDSLETEVYFYDDRQITNNNQLQYHFLACEFHKGVLTAYSFHESGESSTQGLEEKDHAKLARGKSTRRDVEHLLGVPTGKALLPTTVTLPALGIKLGGAPFPLAKVPEEAAEVWQYYSQNLDDYLNKSAQKTLSVFFDSRGTFIELTLMQELVSKVR